MRIQFVASFAPVAPDPATSQALYVGALGLPLREHDDPDYVSSEAIEGSKHFGVWPLAQAAQSCFGTPEWPSDRPVPQASIEFEVGSEAEVADGAAELEAKGYAPLHRARTEPWGQVVARILSPEGLIVGVSYAPWLHAPPGDVDASA